MLLSSSLRRTLVLPVLYSAILISFLTACKNAPSAKDKILQDFDSVNQSLNKLNKEFGANTRALYDSITLKYGEIFLKEFQSAITDTRNYIKYLKAGLIVACGGVGETLPADSYDDLDAAEKFFIKEKNAENLYYKLANVQKAFSSHNDDPLLDEEINKLTLSPKGEGAAAFADAYFNKVPPVAAFTILSKFENDIIVLERKVLQQILKPASRE